MYQEAGFILKPIINKLLNTACSKHVFQKLLPTSVQSVTNMDQIHLKLPSLGMSHTLAALAFGIEVHTVLFLIRSKGSFLFRSRNSLPNTLLPFTRLFMAEIIEFWSHD